MPIFRRYFTVEEERQLFRAIGQLADIHARRDLAWMRLLRQTGIRVQTLSGLNVHDAKEALRTHYLVLRPEITKRQRGGKVFMTQHARRALKTLLQIRRELGCPEAPDEPLIVSRKHQRMSIRSYQDRMRHWCKHAGLTVNGSPHWLRHTLAKRLMKQSTADDPRGVVQGVLNHASISSTAIYTQPDKEEIEQAMEEVS